MNAGGSTHAFMLTRAALVYANGGMMSEHAVVILGDVP